MREWRDNLCNVTEMVLACQQRDYLANLEIGPDICMRC